MKLKAEPFMRMAAGIKKIEYCLNDEKRQKVKVGDIIIFTNREDDSQLETKVIALVKAHTFAELRTKLVTEGYLASYNDYDPIMKKLLCGRNNYEGVKAVLNSHTDKNREPVMKDSWVDFRIHEDNDFREMIWKKLLLTLYDFDSMEFDNKIGSRLRFSRFFDKLPIPFTIDEIAIRLSEMEEYCYDGTIVKAEGYAEAMWYLMTIEGKNFDEKKTFEALKYLLENVKVNPYSSLTNNAGAELLNSFDFIFGDIDVMDSIFLNSSSDDDMDDIMSYLSSGFDVDELIKKIDIKIAELEEEERKEKEALDTKKANKQKEHKDKEKRPHYTDGSDVGRSAEDIKKVVDE